MNAILLANRIDFYNDQTRSARYQRIEYDNAVKEAVKIVMDGILKPGGFQINQFVSDELYTLIKSQSAALTAGIALLPTDYYYLTSVFATISGVEYYCRPTTQNQIGPLLDDSFTFPSATKPYYLQQATGWKIYSGSGTVSSATINYIKTPAVFTIGKDTQLIDAGTGVLSNTTDYIVTMPAVHNSISYNIGDQFTSANTNLTSGQVILAANTTTSDLPARTHELIAKTASSIMLGVAQAYPQSQFSEKEASKT